MKTPSLLAGMTSRFRKFAFALMAALLPGAVSAGLTLDLNVQRYLSGYLFHAGLATNAIAPAAPYGHYTIASPQWPNSGSVRYYLVSEDGARDQGGSFYYMPDEAALLDGITNGLWRLTVTNESGAGEYTFTVTANGFSVDVVPDITITHPLEGDSNLPSRPTFTWTGSAGLSGFVNLWAYQRDANWNWTWFESATLSASEESWTTPRDIPPGQSYFSLQYSTNHPTPLFLSSTPLDTVTEEPLSGWASASSARLYQEVGFSVGGGVGGGHRLVAHYAFDDESNLGFDSSGNGHQINGSSSWGSPTHEFSYDAIAGWGAIEFFGFSSLAPPVPVVESLAGSFTVSAWIKTTQRVGDDYDMAPYGPAVVTAFTNWDEDSVIPFALTGDLVAFYTGGGQWDDDTLYSYSAVNTGDYVHIAVTRDQATGEKKLFVNGALEESSFIHTRPLNAASDLFDLGIGGWPGYEGLLDDLQFYEGVLSDAQIASLHADPGSTIPDGGGGSPLGEALDAPMLTWTTGGDAPWFPQTQVTYDGVSAAQSGYIDDYESSYLETQVTGPGRLSFWWKISSEDEADYLEFEINGSFEDAISGEQDWAEFVMDLGPGTHTLRWTYIKDWCCYLGADAAWLDQVRFSAPVEVSMDLAIVRDVDGFSGERYLVFPGFESISPSPITQHRVSSPTGKFNGLEGGEYGSSSVWMPSLEAAIEEITTGNWTLTLNEGDPSEQVFTFTASISGLTTNLLEAVTIHSPAHGAVGVPTTPAFHWTGPLALPGIYVYAYAVTGGVWNGRSLTVPATNWPSPPTLTEGTNRFWVQYQLMDYPNASFTTPQDSSSQPIDSWTARVTLRSSAFTQFVVGGGPVGELLDPTLTEAGLQFGLATQAGQGYAIDGRTNLLNGTWTTLTNFTGTGGVMEFVFPVTEPPTQFFRARRN